MNSGVTEQSSKWLGEHLTRENLLFAFLLVICAVPIWRLSEFPTQDGPAHVYNAYLLSGWWKAAFPIDRTFFALNPAPVPNWFSTAILASLMQVFSPRISQKVLLTSYVVLLPFAFRYASRSFGHIARYTYFLGFALLWNYFFLMGFFNFCLSLVWYLLLLGYWARKRSCLGPMQITVLFLLSFLLYFSNGLSYYLAVGTVGLLSIAVLVGGPRSLSLHSWGKALAYPQIGLAVAVPLSVWYFAFPSKNTLVTRPAHMTLGVVSWSITRVSILVSSYNAIDLKFSALFGLVSLIAVVAACYARRGQGPKLRFSDALLLAAGGQFILYVIAPQHAGGGGFINYRLFLFAVATLTLWITIQPYNKTTTAVISAAAVVIGLGLGARTFERSRWFTSALEEYKAASSHIEQHKSFLSLHFDDQAGYGTFRDPGLKDDPFMHAGDLLATERNLVDLDDYEAISRNFPIVYRADFDPMKVIKKEGPSALPPLADISGYQHTTGRTVDYVLLWDAQRWNPADLIAQSALQQVHADYVLIYCAENIPLQLYQLRQEVSLAVKTPNCLTTATEK